MISQVVEVTKSKSVRRFEQPCSNMCSHIVKACMKNKPSHDTDLDDFNGDVEIPDLPMRIISPQATNTIPPTPKSSRSRTFSFRNKQGKSVKAKDNSKVICTDEGDVVCSPAGHIPVTDMPNSCNLIRSCGGKQAKTETAATSTSKEVALTSHSIDGGYQEESGSSGDFFVTPNEEIKESKQGLLDSK